MGAFLSEPVTDKISEDNNHQRLNFGVCSMQGWRFTQEDNHSCFPALDEACSLFGVYDGHGGAEVSRYVASLLPDYVLKRESWKEGDVGTALSEAFLALDAHLGSKKGLKVLKKLAAEDDAALDQQKDTNKSSADDDGESEDGSEENVRNLFKEAKMPLELLMAKYGQALAASRNAAESQEDSEGSPSASNSKKASKPKADEDEDGSDEEMKKEDSEEGKEVKKETKEAMEDNKDEVEVKKVDEKSEEVKEDAVGGSGSSGSSESKVKEEGTGDEEKAAKDEPKENGLPEDGEEKPSKNGVGGRTKLRSRQNRIVMTDENDEDDDDSSDEEYDENSSSVIDEGEEEEEDGEEEEESSSGDEDEEVWMPKSDEFALKMLQGPGLDSGCTAVVAVLKDGGALYVANAGDSRCILSRKGVAIDMSVDHKPEDEEESKRIKDAGGEVTSEGRVNGGLNLSRALGDHAYKQGDCGARKQMISALPDVRRIQLRDDEDEFMVLACDGIWNSMTSQNVVDFVRERLYKDLPKGDKTKGAKELRKMSEGVKLSTICGQMFDYCLAPNTSGDGTGCDNMTAILVTFNEALWAKKSEEKETELKKEEEVKSEEKTDGKEESKEDSDGINLLTPPPSPAQEAPSEVEESSAEEEEEEEILDDEDADHSGEESEEEVVMKNKGVGKGCKRTSNPAESPSKAKKQKLEEDTKEETEGNPTS